MAQCASVLLIGAFVEQKKIISARALGPRAHCDPMRPTTNTMPKTENKTRKRLCAFCGRRAHKNKKCPPPCGVYYCDSVCQQQHWSEHRLVCAYRRHKRDRLNAGACAEDSPVAAASASAGESKTGNDSATDLSTLFFASCWTCRRMGHIGDSNTACPF